MRTRAFLSILCVLALLQVVCAEVTIQNQSAEEAAVIFSLTKGTYSGRVAAGGTIFWTTFGYGDFEAKVFPFAPYRDFVQENRILATKLMDPNLSQEERSTAISTLKNWEARLLELEVLGGTATCTGNIPNVQEEVPVTVTINYDPQSVQWSAECAVDIPSN